MTFFRCTCWRNRTKLEKKLIVLSVIAELCILALIVTLSIFVYDMKTGNGDKEDICLTPECIRIASTALELVDFSVDPCEDFYEFTCGNFVKATNIPDDKSAVSVSTAQETLIKEQLRTVIEKPIQMNEPKPFILAKKLYKACMNTTIIERIGLEEIKYMLNNFGDWPVLEDVWNEDNFDWKQTIYKFGREGFSSDYLIDFWISADKKNSSKNIIYLDEAYLGLSREFLTKGLEDKLVQAYYNYMVNIAIILGANKTRAEKELLNSLQFEMKLAKISLPESKRLDPWVLYNPMPIKKLQIKYPSIPWLEYINTILYPDASITSDEIVSVNVPNYISKFEKLINTTPKRVQSNYLIWRAMQSSVFYLTEELRKKRFQFLAVSSGKLKEIPRWRQCISTITDKLDLAIGSLYVRGYFDEASRKSVREIVANTKAEFRNILEKVDWMDENTKSSALEKLASMTASVAYPDELLDDVPIDEFYKNLEVDSTRFWKSILDINKFERKREFSRFRLPVNKTYWVDFSYTSLVNAYSKFSKNSIELPAGILQGIFFHKDYPKYINYGGIGYVIGHEISHGFDNEGRHYDKDGNLVDWWADDTAEAYTKKAKCIIDQYNNYTVAEVELKVNGLTTLGENIADIAGIKEAYFAYTRWMENNGEELSLPGFRNFTGKQMFWISTGMSWCTKRRPENTKQQVLLNEHPPEKYRVWGPISNMQEFAKDFNCKANSKMNPIKKCQIW